MARVRGAVMCCPWSRGGPRRLSGALPVSSAASERSTRATCRHEADPADQEQNDSVAQVDYPGRDRPGIRRIDVAGAQLLSLLEQRKLAVSHLFVRRKRSSQSPVSCSTSLSMSLRPGKSSRSSAENRCFSWGVWAPVPIQGTAANCRPATARTLQPALQAGGLGRRARQDSNLRLLPPEGSALSAELRARELVSVVPGC